MNSNWLSAAMTDDNLVAEFLLLLNRPDSRPPRRAKPSPPLPPLDWGIRQPRSKAAASLTKELDSRRRSPTTPLSWIASGADASLADDFEESSLPLVSASRFKGSAPPDITNPVSSSMMTRRKRTYSELKEEEISLLKQRENLSKQMESLKMKFEEQRSCNEKLKSIKLSASVNEQMQQQNSIGHSKRESTYKAGDSKMKSEEISEYHNFEQIPIFVLPDLNMMPIEDCNPERPERGVQYFSYLPQRRSPSVFKWSTATRRLRLALLTPACLLKMGIVSGRCGMDSCLLAGPPKLNSPTRPPRPL